MSPPKLTRDEREFAKNVAYRMKQARLRADPLLDDVAVALNSRVMYEDLREAERWMLAIKACGAEFTLPE